MFQGTALALRRRIPFSVTSSSCSNSSCRPAIRWLSLPALPPSLSFSPRLSPPNTTTAGYAQASSPFHKNKADSPSREKEEGAGAVGGKGESLRQRLKHAPIDPRLYQHLERLGLGSESTIRHKKLKKQQKKRKLTVGELRGIDAQITRDSIPYFQAVRREGGRDLGREGREGGGEGGRKEIWRKSNFPQGTDHMKGI